MDEEKLTRFLRLVPQANWRRPPAVWAESVREALSDKLVTIGFGGVMKLTEAGKLRVYQHITDEELHEQIMGSDLYSPTVKKVMQNFCDALDKRRAGVCGRCGGGGFLEIEPCPNCGGKGFR